MIGCLSSVAGWSRDQPVRQDQSLSAGGGADQEALGAGGGTHGEEAARTRGGTADEEERRSHQHGVSGPPLLPLCCSSLPSCGPEADLQARGAASAGLRPRLQTDLGLLCRCSPQENQEEEAEERSLEEQFWNTPCAFSPESRLAAHHHLEKSRRSAER